MADVLAPGLNRAEEPLLRVLSSDPRYHITPIRFPFDSHRILLPYVYGPLPAQIAARRSDLVHITNSWYAHLVPLLHGPVIVTCHDLIEFEDLLAGKRFKLHRRFHLRAAFRGLLRSRFIVCVSQATANRIASYAPAAVDRLRVVYSGLSGDFRPGPVDRDRLGMLGVNQPYVLFVGSEQPRKNLPRLVAAVAEARRALPDLHFVKVGGSQTAEGRDELLASLRRQNLSERFTLIESVSDELLARLYRGAAVTVLPSSQEGFGFPPLEAMACGCPSIVSSIDTLMEVTGGNALVVDPFDERELARAIERVVTDGDLRAALVQKGLQHAAGFTWEHAGQAYGELYEEAMRRP